MSTTARKLENTNFSSAEFTDRLRRRESAAIETLVRSYTKQLYRAARGMRLSDEDAQEVVQRTWTTLFEVVPRFEGRSHIRTFVFGILYNKVAEFRRERAKMLANDPIEDVMESRFADDGHWSKPPIDPQRFVLALEKIEWLKHCFDELAHVQSSALQLKQIEGLSTKEVCKILNVTGTNLGVLLYRARNKLRNCLENRAEST